MKIFISLLIVFTLSIEARADQLAYISKDQAEKAVELLSEQKEIVLWCACCEGNIRQKVSISKVYFQYTGYENFYCVMLEAIDENGNKITEELDLAYVHFRIGSKAYNVGHTLGLACDPCTIPFTW
jgi:hypothetical protein